jgi:hypothetical protein
MNVQVDLSQYDVLEHDRYNMQVSRLREHVRTHLGDDIAQEVVTFLFREDLLKESDRMFPSAGEFPLLPGKAINAVRLNNEDVLAFPPVPAPDIPGNTKVGITRYE